MSNKKLAGNHAFFYHYYHHYEIYYYWRAFDFCNFSAHIIILDSMMRHVNSKFCTALLPALMLFIFFTACADDDGDSEKWYDITRSNVYSGSGSEVYLVDTNGNVHLTYTLSLGSYYRNVYFIFTNTTFADATQMPVVKNLKGDDGNTSDDSESESVSVPETRAQVSIAEQPIVQRGTPEITEFNHRPIVATEVDSSNTLLRSLITPAPLKADTVGQTGTFYDDNGKVIHATCRKVVAKDGSGIPVTVNIWVADDCWQPCSKAKCVTSDMVDALTDKFIKSGTNNDIYEWTTNIFGPEWEQTAHNLYPNDLINDNDEITILLFDISGDNSSSGGVVGFFYARDNFIKKSTDPILQYSNERIMFYLDAVMFANGDGEWGISDQWPATIVSTLAHEFQHMIHFYQKTVLRASGDSTETWLDELCSLVTEDILAYYMQVDGPRGVLFSDPTAGAPGNTNPRLPEYNYYNDISLIDWNNSTPNYAINYAFGAYLARNFGGAPFLRDIVQNSYTNYRAIEYALSRQGYTIDFATALRKWAAANLLSNSTTPPTGYYQYNSGTWFTSTLSGTEYKLGSINLYNYRYNLQTGPYIYSTLPTGTQDKTSNIYYLAGSNQTGQLIYKIDLPKEIKLTVVVK